MVVDMVRGQSLSKALALLQFTPKKGAMILKKLMESARSNAHKKNIDVDVLRVQRIAVDRGPTMYRMMTRQRGMAHRIRKRSSHITVTLGE